MPPKKKVPASVSLAETTGPAWTKRRVEATRGLIEQADPVVQLFYGPAASPEVRARPDAEFVTRLTYVATIMALEWTWAAAVLDDSTVTVADRRADFVHHINTAWDGCDTLLRLVTEAQALTDKEWQAAVLDAANQMENALLRAIGLMVSPSDFEGGGAWYDAFEDSPALTPAFFLQIHRELMKVLTELMALRRALLRISERQQEAPESGPISDAERARRYRARKRRRVAFQIPFDVYDDDLEMLRRYGLLTLPEKADRGAVADALDALLVNAFVTYPHERFPWRERIARQRGRISAVHEREKSQDDE